VGVGKINVYITALGQPCTIDNTPWVVAVTHCDGTILNWSEGRYKDKPDGPWASIVPHVPPGAPVLPQGWWYDSVPAGNGHVEIEVPPGQYVVTASKHTWIGVVNDDGFKRYILYGNWYTHHAIISVSCGDDVCATLYSPTVQLCMYPINKYVITMVLRSLKAQSLIEPEDAQAVEQAANVIQERLVKPLMEKGITPYESRYLENLSRAFQTVKFEGEEAKKR
jgi:hypothetical protein